MEGVLIAVFFLFVVFFLKLDDNVRPPLARLADTLALRRRETAGS